MVTTTRVDAGLVVRLVRQVRADLEQLLEAEAIGGFAGCRGDGPLKLPGDVILEVQQRLALVAEAERLVGRSEDGPRWLDRLIDGTRAVVAAG